MDFSIQTILETHKVRLVPLQESDFERLYQVASDPLVWEQHPNKNRFQKDIFRNFFDGAMISEGAFIIIDKISNEVAGSTRDRKSTRLNSSHEFVSRMPSSA